MLEKFKNFGYASFVATLVLVAFGTVAIYSAGHARDPIFHGMWKANLVTAAFAFAIYFAAAFFDYRAILKWLSVPAYAASVVFLVAVLFLGSEIYGGRRWLWFFQPSEVAKLSAIMLFAWMLGRGGSRGFGSFAAAAALAALPFALILAEPDLGTALALVPALVAMMLAADVWRRGLVTCLALASVAALLLLGAVYEAERPGVSQRTRENILRFVPLKSHQIRRVRTFLYPETDPLGDGYTLRQAKISIGSGGFSGKGVGKGETNSLKFLPPSVSMNDFIFCVWAEETGFLGSAALLALYAVVCLSGVWTAFTAADLQGRLLALGVSTLVFAHVAINTAMSVGMMPITGLPLPFMSSGRTFLATAIVGLGLVQSVSTNKTKENE